MMTENLLLTCFSILILVHFLQTSHADKVNRHYCSPSACGIIRNISYPFRLKDDPKPCGDPNYELACEDNVTSLYLNSQKYHVKAINYHNTTVRLAVVSIKNYSCSFPNYSLYRYLHPYSIGMYSTSSGDTAEAAWPINFWSCPYQLNSSIFTEITDWANGEKLFNASNSSTGRHTYIKVGHMYVSEVKETCRVDLMVLTSWKFKNLRNVSVSEIHDSLLYGFELTWLNNDSDYSAWGIRLSVFLIFSGLTFAARFIIPFACVIGLLIYKFQRRHLSMFDAIERFLQSDNKLMPIRYSYPDIKKMTRGFREKLGEGGYGSVYKGKLRSGHDVAIKLLRKPGGNGQDFMNEIATIGRIHHVNVVKLVGYCAERSKRALVFDFMPNGSLEKYIYSRDQMNFLTWETKFKIAVGVARGIEYLHRGCDIQILHFDIKPHNILLDDKFIPKISDFGLAKFCSTQKNTITLTAARGTIGYVAPELINRGIGGVSYKADVYSFGMLLIEMVGLKRDLIGHNDNSSQYFPYWIYDCFNQGKDIEIGDANEKDDDDNDSTKKIARKMAIVALWCIQMIPRDRPSMNKVLEMLEGEVENLQIPPRPSLSPQVIGNEDQTWSTCSTNSISLFCHDVAPSVEITAQDL